VLKAYHQKNRDQLIGSFINAGAAPTQQPN
jgi:hypothetical protein